MFIHCLSYNLQISLMNNLAAKENQWLFVKKADVEEMKNDA